MKFKAYITKYALTRGIQCVDAEDTLSSTMIVYRPEGSMPQFFHKPHWHDDKFRATDRVRAMIASKRRSIAKVLKKLDDVEKELK